MEWLVTVAEDNVDLNFDPIFRFALSDPDSHVRKRAISGLWECDDRNIVAPLIDILKTDRAEDVSAAAAIALGKFGLLAQTGGILIRDGDRIMDALLSVITGSGRDMEVRRRSLEAAAYFNTSRVRDLIRWAYGSADRRLKQSALFAMGKTADPVWIPTLISESQSSDPAVRYETAVAFAEIAEEDLVPYVIQMLDDEDLQVQLTAIQTLGSIGGNLAERALKRCMKHDEESIQDAAEEALAQIEAEADPLGFRFSE